MDYIIQVDNYQIKFDKIGPVIRVSIPYNACEVNTDEKREFTKIFIEELRARGWRSRTIQALESYIFNEDEWLPFIKMNSLIWKKIEIKY